MSAKLIQRKPIIQVEPAEIRLVVVVPVRDGERVPIESDDCDLELVVGTRGRAITVAGKIVKVESVGATPRVSAIAPSVSTGTTVVGSTDYRLTIKTDGSWANGPARR